MSEGERPLPAELSGYPEPFNDFDLDLAFGGAEARDAPTWKPTDDGAADWAMRKLAETVFAGRPIAEQAAAWRERIDEWEQRELAPLERRAEFFRGLLEQYGLDQREASEGERKTIRLPAGTISTRGSEAQQLTIITEDFLTCMRTAPPLVRETLTRLAPKPASELKKLLHTYVRLVCPADGEIHVRREESPRNCPVCGSDCDELDRFVGIPTFGLADAETMETHVFKVEGAMFTAPPAPSATVALADERALPRTTVIST